MKVYRILEHRLLRSAARWVLDEETKEPLEFTSLESVHKKVNELMSGRMLFTTWYTVKEYIDL